jgi:hypothetical protein
VSKLNLNNTVVGRFLFIFCLSLDTSHPSLFCQAGQANISEEQLIDRLMGIVGHLVQRKTLKVHFHCLEYYLYLFIYFVY